MSCFPRGGDGGVSGGVVVIRMGNKQTKCGEERFAGVQVQQQVCVWKEAQVKVKFRALLQQKTRLMRQGRHEVTGTHRLFKASNVNSF